VPREQAFREMIRRVRAGDQAAATELVQRYEPEIHKAIRVQLLNYRLNRVLDSSDISQTVLANFFACTAAGRFELNEPEQLVKLLVTMARNQLLDEARRHQADRRDTRRIDESPSEDIMEGVQGTDPTPSQVVAGHELVQEVYRRLTDEERALAEQRAAGLDWATIAARRGGSPEALRKKLARAIDRIGVQLGLGAMHIA
jgi:RNA polymerase sigma factor (sigma-70 family)